MSVYVRVNSKSRKIRDLKAMVEYAFNPEKTMHEYCHTLGVAKDTAYQDMVFVKQLFGQTEGRQLLHWVLSFDKGVSTEMADTVGREVLQLLAGKYQAIAATHLNTDNRHVHFVINPVDIVTGKKFSESMKDMMSFRKRIDFILERYSLPLIGATEKMSEEEWEMYENPVTYYEEQDLSENDLAVSETSDEIYKNFEGNWEKGNYSIQTFADGSWYRGNAVIQGHTVLMPGVFYEHSPKLTFELIRGVTYDEDVVMPESSSFKVTFNENGEEYFGIGYMENGKTYIPGILYSEQSKEDL